jgi:hypothetical protein
MENATRFLRSRSLKIFILNTITDHFIKTNRHAGRAHDDSTFLGHPSIYILPNRAGWEGHCAAFCWRVTHASLKLRFQEGLTRDVAAPGGIR